MASITQFRKKFKDDYFAKIKFISEYFSTKDIMNSITQADHRGRDRIWNPAVTFWTFMLQVLHAGSSCRDAVAMFLAEQAASGKKVTASVDPSGYCQSRSHLPRSLFSDALKTVGQKLQEKACAADLWFSRRLWVVDGSSCSMPDTPMLQEHFGQPSSQKAGCGFPVAKIVAMFCWATGAVLDIAVGPYCSSELYLWRQLWGHLKPGDIVLGDRFYCVYAYLAQLQDMGCDGVFRLNGSRALTMDFRKGQRLGKNDVLITWTRPLAPSRGLSQNVIDALPPTLQVRIIRYHIQTPGFQSEEIMVATTLLDAKTYRRNDLAELYRDRWTVELRLRDIKTTSEMDILRGKSVDVIYKEIYMHLLVYNLIRALMRLAAREHGSPLHRLSYAGTVQHLNAVIPYLWLLAKTKKALYLYQMLLEWVAHDILPYRPDRIEPRVIKRRMKEYGLLNKPRHIMREQLVR